MRPEEYVAKRDWLRSYPHHPRAKMVMRELRTQERELEAEGTSIEEWLRAHRMTTSPRESGRATLGRSSRGYVAFWPDRPGQPPASVVYHTDRQCQYIRGLGDEYVRQATDAEMERLPLCGGRDCGG
jgi:hypothetical protein